MKYIDLKNKLDDLTDEQLEQEIICVGVDTRGGFADDLHVFEEDEVVIEGDSMPISEAHEYAEELGYDEEEIRNLPVIWKKGDVALIFDPTPDPKI